MGPAGVRRGAKGPGRANAPTHIARRFAVNRPNKIAGPEASGPARSVRNDPGVLPIPGKVPLGAKRSGLPREAL
ncbi:hypothetical protein OCH239_05475 [Roseivivax halodurans JCM 10272]|uniref:Uncharacterized protein n=1 Tax=Roseivivax halodurans JCM 10272 TaxID=1449350 RepID=X7EDT0_9RHOB|nr:hypothetical protein OCH239_05475 [Roseivivax halodurans JCM 10272]